MIKKAMIKKAIESLIVIPQRNKMIKKAMMTGLITALVVTTGVEAKDKNTIYKDSTIYVTKEVSRLSAKSKAIKKYGFNIKIIGNIKFTRYKKEGVQACRKIVAMKNGSRKELIYCKRCNKSK